MGLAMAGILGAACMSCGGKASERGLRPDACYENESHVEDCRSFRLVSDTLLYDGSDVNLVVCVVGEDAVVTKTRAYRSVPEGYSFVKFSPTICKETPASNADSFGGFDRALIRSELLVDEA